MPYSVSLFLTLSLLAGVLFGMYISLLDSVAGGDMLPSPARCTYQVELQPVYIRDQSVIQTKGLILSLD